MASLLPDRHPRSRATLMARALIRGKIVDAQASEVSLTGCYLEGIPESPEPIVAVELPICSPPVRARARVVRTDERIDEHGYNVALAFEDLSWDDLCAIARFLAPQI